MTQSKFAVRAALILLFVTAVWVRLQTADELLYPYYEGESATNYRHANLVADQGSLPPLDDKTSFPDGYAPSQVGPNGVEYLTAYLFRTVSIVTDMSLKEFSGRFLVLVFSLCVFTFYRIARELWRSRASGLLAAFFVALSVPVISGSFGREYVHAPFAILAISLHLAIFLAYLRRPATIGAVAASVIALVVTAVWRNADLYLVFFAGIAFFAPGLDLSGRRRMIGAHLVAILFAGILWPHLRAERFVLSWVPILFLTSTVYLIAKPSLPKKISGWAWVVGGTILLSVLAAPLAKGGIAKLSELDYWMFRLRFLFAKPDNPLELSDTARFLWTQARTYPRLLTIVAFFLPFVFLIQPAIKSLRALEAERRAMIWPAVAFALFGIILFLVDRSAVFAAALGCFPLIAVAARGIGRHAKMRLIPIVLACALAVTQALVPSGRANPAHMVASALGASTQQSDGFLWISIGNADLELIRHLATRTSVVDAMMTPPDVSSLLVSFAGRKTVLTPGVFTNDALERTNRFMKTYYDDEGDLYDDCVTYDIKYVLYSIDLLLDNTVYSPRYSVGLRQVGENSLAHSMHFEPERLQHFNLVYQNDNYRLFRVTKDIQPFFLTDHPPVYQKSILEQHGGHYETFYTGVVDALLAYQLAIDAQRQEDDPEAIRRFRYCLNIAPRFTNAWLGVGDSLFRLGDIEAANAAYSRALDAAPDNPNALYNAALTAVRLGKIDQAKGLLDVLISSSRDRAMVQQARDLRAAIDRDYPQDGGSTQ